MKPAKDSGSGCKYGCFDSENREYVIHSPLTPKAWINYIGGTGDLDAFLSNRAGGAAWYKQPHTGRLTRYQYMSLPEDRSGFYLYVRNAAGKVWNPSWCPCRTDLDRYECRHGLYYTKFDAEKDGLRVRVKYFIPVSDPVLLWDISLTNTGMEDQTFQVYPYMDFSMRDYLKDVLYYHFCGNQMTGAYNAELHALQVDYFAYEAPYCGYTLFNASRPFSSYDMKRESFVGRCRSEEDPVGVETGTLSGSEVPGGGFPVCGAFRLDFTLKAGASERVVVKLAVDRQLDRAGALLRKYDDFAAVDAADRECREWWDRILAKNQVQTPDPALNEMLNVWFPKNIKTTMRCGRSISHRHTGSGTSLTFRDSMQDNMIGTLFFPEETKNLLLLLMRSVRSTGQITHSIDPADFSCPNPDYNRCDAVVWGVFTIAKYVAETGDEAFLQTPVKDFEGNDSTVIDLLVRAMRFTGTNTGKHGLPKLFNCDWNDSLVIISAILKDGESVMVAEQYIAAAKILIRMLKDDRYAADRDFFRKKIGDFSAALDSPDVWDGAWYRRLLFPDAHMGSSDNEEGRIFLNTQTWAALAGTLNPDHVDRAMKSVREFLSCDCGIRLAAPPFTRVFDGSRYTGNAPGAGENGGLFYHANTWAVIAEAIRGNSDAAWEYFRHILPCSRASADPDLYEREPYAFASWVYGPENASYGHASLTHLTGGAAWIYRAATEYLLGIRPDADGLIIDPCIPAEWDGFRVDREFAGAFFHIDVRNPQHKTGGSIRLTVNGKPVAGNRIGRASAGTHVEVVAEIVEE